jgi:lysine 2,3-aminomutase
MEENTIHSSETDEPPHRGGTAVQDIMPAAAATLTCLSKKESSRTTTVRRPVTPLTRADNFRLQWFPETTQEEWNDWRWQLKNRFETLHSLNKIFMLSDEELCAVLCHKDSLPMAITPYYASLIDREDAAHPLRRAMIPVAQEMVQSPGESTDPLSEGEQSPVQGIVHRYPDRVLFLVTNVCACYCRYCTRSRIVGQCKEKQAFTKERWKAAIAYIESHTEIRDVLMSGGDPLMLPDNALQWLLSQLRRIPHVEMIRIGSKAPVVLPQRITPALISILKRHHPLWMSLHFTHPEEISPEVKTACERLADAGIPLGSQTVLLSGVNDSPDVLKTLFHKLLTIRVRPYYLYQCDPIMGSAHFRTTVQKGIDIIRQLRGHTTGYAIPQYVIDAPGGGGKIPIMPEYASGYEGTDLILHNYQGNTYRYPDVMRGTAGE